MRKFLAAIAAIGVSACVAYAATLPLLTGPQPAGDLVSIVNTLIQSANSQITPQSMANQQTPRNYLDNGAMQVTQRGTGAATCALNGAAITSAAYAADRWGCQVNVAVGAGQLTAITATPSPPPGFSTSLKLVRNSGALTQPQCAYQEIPTFRATQLAGQQVMLSAYVQALAGLAADQGAAAQSVTFLIITGTGSDQGLGTWTASPALTPAWTGVATLQSTAVALPTTPAWARYSGAAVAVPTTVTEMAVAICFTPTATGAGTTDGFAVTGVQLEALGANATTASPFEFRLLSAENAEAQRYFYRLTETAAITPIASCTASDTTHAQCLIQFPVQMRAVPTMTYTAGFATPTTTAQTTLGACTALATSATVASTAANVFNVPVQCTATTVPAAGSATMLFSNNGSGLITASADF